MYSRRITAEHEAFPPKTWSQKLRRVMRQMLAQANALALRPESLSPKRQYVFVLSHMRSGSTLLCHLLCSSGEIIGFGETHNNYHCRSDLAKLLVSVRTHTKKNPLEYRYVLDKLVGSKDVLSGAILADHRTRYLFLVREPVPSIGSIVLMRREYYHEAFDQAVEFATKYYAERLPQLVQLAARIDDPHRCLLMTYEQLLAETPSMFRALEKFLGLREPLSENYEISPTSGKLGFGDPSANILLGKINRSLPRKNVDLLPQLQASVEDCYARSVNELREIIPMSGRDS